MGVESPQYTGIREKQFAMGLHIKCHLFAMGLQIDSDYSFTDTRSIALHVTEKVSPSRFRLKI